MSCCDPWPLSPRGELLLGVKLESPEGIVNSEEIIAVPGLGFAEMRPGVSASLSATSRSHATPIRRKCGRRESASLQRPQISCRLSRNGYAGEHYRQAR
jgi:hypothetical protein